MHSKHCRQGGAADGLNLEAAKGSFRISSVFCFPLLLIMQLRMLNQLGYQSSEWQPAVKSCAAVYLPLTGGWQSDIT